MPLVSVVIPTYNRADLICETINTVLQQTFRDFEVIVVDDGSTDGTDGVLEERYGTSIRLIRQANAGEGEARNAGIAQADGKYVAFLDSDDLWLPPKLESQIELLTSRPGLGWVYCDGISFSDGTRRPLRKFSRVHAQYEGAIAELLLVHAFVPSPTPLVGRSLLEIAGPFWKSPKAADWDMWLRLAELSEVGVVRDPLVRYRVHKGMITANQGWLEKHQAGLAVIARAVDRRPDLYSKVVDRALGRQCFRSGKTAALSGQRDEGLRLFWSSLKSDPFYIQTYFGLTACALGGWTIPFLSGTRRHIRQSGLRP